MKDDGLWKKSAIYVPGNVMLTEKLIKGIVVFRVMGSWRPELRSTFGKNHAFQAKKAPEQYFSAAAI